MSSLTRLILIRHGESVGNVQGIMQGSGPGARAKAAPYDRLTPQGHHQALALGHHLAQPSQQASEQTAPPTHLYSSPARRTQQTLSALLWAYRLTLRGATWTDLQRQWQGLAQSTDARGGFSQALPPQSRSQRGRGTLNPLAPLLALWGLGPGDEGGTFAAHRLTDQDCLDFLALNADDRPDHDRPDHDRPLEQFQLDDRLQEINNGIFCGLTWTQAQQQYPGLCQQLLNSPDWVPIPQAETPQQCHDRAQAWIQTVTQLPSGSQIWAVTHGGILPYLWAAILGCDRTWGFTAAHTACFELCWDGDRWQSITRSSNTRHNTTLWHIAQFNNTDHYRLLSAS